MNMPVPLLVTYDGSDVSREVFEPAADLARQTGAALVLLRVHRAPDAVWVHPDAAHREQKLAELQETWQADLAVIAEELAREARVEVLPVARCAASAGLSPTRSSPWPPSSM